MKRILRIVFGLCIFPLPILLGTFMWLFEEDLDWWEEVGLTTWWLVSGQWEKLPD